MDPDALGDVGRIPHGGTDGDLLDFSANVNPAIPDGVREVYEAGLDRSRSYPNDGYPDFRGAAGEYVGADPESVIPTAGGMAAIRLAIETTVRAGDSVLVPFPSFGEYAREVRLQGAEPAFVPCGDLLDADPEGHALSIVCTPNNPTGDAYEPAPLRAFASRCREAGTPLLVDEAFLGFTDLPSLSGESGVVVARSLTKLFGLPGVRAGFAVATGPLRERLEAARPTWALGAPAAAVGSYCLRQEEFVTGTRARVESERNRMRERLATRFEVSPSVAPFLLVDVGREPSGLVDRLLEQGIAVRDATTFRGLDSHVRVAVRLPSENDRLLEALDV